MCKLCRLGKRDVPVDVHAGDPAEDVRLRLPTLLPQQVQPVRLRGGALEHCGERAHEDEPHTAARPLCLPLRPPPPSLQGHPVRTTSYMRLSHLVTHDMRALINGILYTVAKTVI